MPQAPRKESQRAQDKESKRAKGALSCAECRRLKLKCDKTVPCSSCKRRGCSAICPNGSLITGQGTRFVLADTEKLHQKIATMSDRIRQLEDALAILQSTHTKEPHPLLHRDLLHIKSSIELHSAVESEDGPVQQEEVDESQYIDAFGTLALHDDGAATFYGRSAGSESLLIGETVLPADQSRESPQQRSASGQMWHTNISSSVSDMSQSFPLSPGPLSGVSLEVLVDTYLPPWDQAWRLCELYLEQAPWFFGAVTRRQLHEEILPLWYSEAQSMVPSSFPSQSQTPSGSALPSPSQPHNKGTSHDLALLTVLFCFGALTDNSLPAAPDNPVATQFYQLTRAALSLEPILHRPPSVATVQTLSLMAIYEGLCSGENSIESTWALMGLATKLAQSIGLHRDSARWKLPPAEVQKRRALFWELFITDCWQSLATGRLATFSLPFVDCELPFDSDRILLPDGTPQPSFPFWKARFGAECVSAVVQGTLTSRAPKYSIILELDRKVRDMELPRYAQETPRQNAGLSEAMSHFMPFNYRELTLLYIHRCFFAHAITSHPNDPIKSQYAPSFLAGYRSACNLISSLKDQFSRFPAQIARFWVLWTHAFSSAVMLSSVVIHSAKSKVASAALIELRSALELFESAATYGGRAVKFLPIIQRLHTKAQNVFLQLHVGSLQSIPNNIFTLSTGSELKDEMSIFSGRTHTVAKVTSGRQNDLSPGPSRSASDSPKNVTSNPAFADVHPNLVEQLHGFESHIHARIQNAYSTSQDPFKHALSAMKYDVPQTTAGIATQHLQDNRQHAQLRYEAQETYPSRPHHSQSPPSNAYVSPVEEPNTSHYHQTPSYHYNEPGQYAQPPEPHYLPPRPSHNEPQQRQLQQQQQQEHDTSHSYQQSQLQSQPPLQQSHATISMSTQPQLVRAPPASASVPQYLPPSHARSHPNHQASYNQYPAKHFEPQPQSLQQVLPVSHHLPDLSQQAPVQQYYTDPSSSDNAARGSDGSGGSHYASSSGTSSIYSPQPPAQPPMGISYYQEPVANYANYENSQSTTEIQTPYPIQQYYTPDGALRGIAADDNSLQETWQSYMNQVGSPGPRHLFED